MKLCRETTLMTGGRGLLALWLGIQFLIVAASPAWGFVLPHEHVVRGVADQAAWQEHLREHRLGIAHVQNGVCPSFPSEIPQDASIVSVPHWDATSSLLTLFGANVTAGVALIRQDRFLGFHFLHSFTTLDVHIPPPDPPPWTVAAAIAYS